jgi:hypothetical protein
MGLGFKDDLRRLKDSNADGGEGVGMSDPDSDQDFLCSDIAEEPFTL